MLKNVEQMMFSLKNNCRDKAYPLILCKLHPPPKKWKIEIDKRDKLKLGTGNGKNKIDSREKLKLSNISLYNELQWKQIMLKLPR